VDFVAYTLVMLLLLTLSAALIAMHRRTWHQIQTDQQSSLGAREFSNSQYRRRVQASSMIGIVGVAIFIGQFTGRYPLLWVFYWGGVILILFWIILLALGDMVATQAYFHRVRREDLHEQARLHAELRRQQNSDSNGQSADPGEE
jgi:hypothetical protein